MLIVNFCHVCFTDVLDRKKPLDYQIIVYRAFIGLQSQEISIRLT